MKIVLVTGSRHYRNQERIERQLRAIGEPFCLVTGGARGADAIAEEIAQSGTIRNIQGQVVCPALWKTHGRGAGPVRNQFMLDVFEPSLVLAFPLPDSKGTWDMVNKARAKGILVIVFQEGDEKPEPSKWTL